MSNSFEIYRPPGSLTYISLQRDPTRGVYTCQLENPKWDPATLDLTDLCLLRVLLVRTLRKVEDELDRQDLNLLRRQTLRTDVK
jgi:hypothetical protein